MPHLLIQQVRIGDAHQTAIKATADVRFIYLRSRADEDQFLPTVAMDWVPVAVDTLPPLRS